jgi:sugar lactone lactonase YvrE
MPLEPAVLVHSNCELGEGPVWDSKRRRLWWVDITEGRLHYWDLADGMTGSWQFEHPLSAVLLTETPVVVLALGPRLVTFDPSSGISLRLAELEGISASCRWNDAKVDPQGRAWLGLMEMREERQAGAGALYLMDRLRGLECQLDGLTIPNGADWAPDSRTMYFVDSPTRMISARAFSPDTAQLGEPNRLVDLAGYAGVPDGLTVAADGSIWVAFWEGSAVRGFDVDGQLLAEVVLPVSQVTSCCFGGGNYSRMFITTGRYGLSEAQLASQPLAGSVFHVAMDSYRGRPANRYCL